MVELTFPSRNVKLMVVKMKKSCHSLVGMRS